MNPVEPNEISREEWQKQDAAEQIFISSKLGEIIDGFVNDIPFAQLKHDQAELLRLLESKLLALKTSKWAEPSQIARTSDTIKHVKKLMLLSEQWLGNQPKPPHVSFQN